MMIIVRFAAFNAPNKGDKISIGNKPGEYFLVLDRTMGKDPRGQTFWQARVKGGQDGREQLISSDNIPSWSHFKGPNYGWHDEDNARNKQQGEQAALKKQRDAFEAVHKVGETPLRVGTIVEPVGAGPLDTFVGHKFKISAIDYNTGMATLVPDKASAAALQGMEELFSHVPVKDLMQGTKVVAPAVMQSQPGARPNGGAAQSMEEAAQLMALVEKGQVQLSKPEVFINFRKNGQDGVQLFTDEMARYGIGLEEGDWTPQRARGQYDAEGQNSISPNRLWTGKIKFTPPFANPVALLAEIKSLAPNSKPPQNIDPNKPFMLHSNPIWRLLASNGVPVGGQDEDQTATMPAPAGVAAFVKGLLRKTS